MSDKMEEMVTKKPGVMGHTYNPSTWEAETGGSQVCGQPQLLSEALHNFSETLFQNKE